MRVPAFDLFFGREGEQQHEKPGREAEAKEVCARCLVRAACLEDAWSAASGSASLAAPVRTSAG